MTLVYRYLYYHYYLLAQKFTKRYARGNAVLYLTAVGFMVLLPFVIASFIMIFDEVSYGSLSIIAGGFTVFIYTINRCYFSRKTVIRRTYKEFAHQSEQAIHDGLIFATGLLILAPVLFLLLLGFMSLLDR
ncbi:hypothetical protein [Chitinophaga sp.]|uniref:hypothetical protein n=1 Tax=Chitinophaga sp. TaxID=1869181 RepID=UPI0031D095D1